MDEIVKVKIISDGCMPHKTFFQDAGFDVHAIEEYKLGIGEQLRIRTGLRLAIPSGWYGQIADRSSLAAGRIYTSGGVIDPSYRGEVSVLLRNESEKTYMIRRGDRIAQILFLPVPKVAFELVGALPVSERGENGFGSTGV